MTLTPQQIRTQASRPGHRYIVRDISEECQCGGCGYPLYADDTAYDVNGEAACGRLCAEEIEARQKRREEALDRVCPPIVSEIEDNQNGGAL